MGILQSPKWADIFCKAALVWTGIVFGVGLQGGPALWAWSPSDVYIFPYYGTRSGYTREHIPYFALHPPVYYTVPMGRPYGWSPFAYPAWVQTPQVEPPRPMIVPNPYVVGFGHQSKDQTLGEQAPGTKTHFAVSSAASPPIRIINPYYTEAEGQEGQRAASPTERPGPKTVVSSTAQVQPRRIRNPYISDKK